MKDLETSEAGPSEVDEKAKKKKKIKREIRSFALIIFIVFFFRSVFFEPFKIPSGSMIPTLMIGDFILVNKFSYGFKVPFSDWFSDPIYITGPENPERGDVVVFKYPQDVSFNYIKRVMGLPGEEIEIKDKTVYINGKPIETTPINGKEIMDDMDDKFKHYNLNFFEVELGEDKHIIQINADSIYNSEYMPTKIPEGHFFVMGDNRDFSSDSRFWGFVPHEYIKGKAVMVWFSIILPWGGDNFKFRPWRIGKTID